MKHFEFKTVQEAEAFRAGVEWVNDSAIVFEGITFHEDTGLFSANFTDEDEEEREEA